MPESKIMADAGHVAWDMDRFKFLLEQPEYDSVHPSLKRISVLNMNYGLYEVVPGISSSIAAPSAGGIPVTHRGVSTHLTIVTGHEDPEKPETQTDWSALAKAGGTLVLVALAGNALLGWRRSQPA